jgi:hypothetical protein
MIDLYKIAGDIPGVKDTLNDSRPRQRVVHLEEQFAQSIGDHRFHPYIQLHEFESLLFTDLGILSEQYPALRKEIEELDERLKKHFQTPEEINRLTPPSYRIRQVVPDYDKILDSVTALSKIGLPALRTRCPHFGQWCNFLESVA